MTQSHERLNDGTLYRFHQRLDNESYKRLVQQRNQVFLRMEHKPKENSKARSLSSHSLSIWERKPVDFSRKKYDPHPPKRNARESIRPWTYDKYLRKPEDENIFWEKPTIKKKCNEILLEKSLGGFENDEYDFDNFDTSYRPRSPKSIKNSIWILRFIYAINEMYGV